MPLLSDVSAVHEGRFIRVICHETDYGTVLREQAFIDRIKAGEDPSYEFIVEIAESTLTFLVIKNLLENLIRLGECRGFFNSENMNLKCIVASIISSIDAQVPSGAIEMTAATIRRSPRGEVDLTGWGLKRYPRDYPLPEVVR